MTADGALVGFVDESQVTRAYLGSLAERDVAVDPT
jgi:hypothetical protein